ncbi:MAG: molybdenum cofactor guanylyltransferase [Actinomycetota bacterium]|nr:molybdenum cofactor guanylyltransferase [Actinomycetota bacterium]
MGAALPARDGTPPALGAVLAGGRGSRMGGPKATVALSGRPLIDYPLAALAAAGIEAVVVAKSRSELPPLEAPVWVEPPGPSHPLSGILAALRRAGRPVLAVGCDMPFLSGALLSWLATLHGRLVVPTAGGRLQPLLARYDPSLEPALARALEREDPLHRALAELDRRLVTEQEIERFGAPRRLLFNVNTPEDLILAERMLRG